MQTVAGISALAFCIVALRLYFAQDNSLSVGLSEDFADDDVFIQDDLPTQTTVVYMTETKCQYVTVV